MRRGKGGRRKWRGEGESKSISLFKFLRERGGGRQETSPIIFEKLEQCIAQITVCGFKWFITSQFPERISILPRTNWQINLHSIFKSSRGNMCENYWIRGKNISVCPASQFYPSNITKQKTGWQPYKWVTSRVLIKQVMCRLDKDSGLKSYFNAESWCHSNPIRLIIVQNTRKHP